MRIVVVTQYFWPEVGAPQVRLAALVGELRSRGHEVDIVTAMPHYPHGQIFPGYRRRFRLSEPWDHDPAVTVHRVWLRPGVGRGFSRLVGMLTFAGLAPFGARRVRRPDLVLTNSPPLTVACASVLLARRWKAKHVLLVADLWPASLFDIGGRPPEPIARAMEAVERFAYARSDAVAGMTQHIVDQLRGRSDVAPERVTFLPNGVHTDRFEPALVPDPRRVMAGHAAADSISVDDKVFVFPGTIGVFNGLDVVLDAMASLRNRPDIHVVFIGDGEERERLEHRSSAEQLDRVHFIGRVPIEEMAERLPHATAGLVCLRDLPVTRGARPAKTFPVLAAGLPVVFVGLGEGPGLIERAGAGLTVEPDDAAGLARALVQIADEPELRRQMGEAGRNFAETEHEWEAVVGRWLAELDVALDHSLSCVTASDDGGR